MLDLRKVNGNTFYKLISITYDPVHHTYRKLGDVVGKSFSEGKEYNCSLKKQDGVIEFAVEY